MKNRFLGRRAVAPVSPRGRRRHDEASGDDDEAPLSPGGHRRRTGDRHAKARSRGTSSDTECAGSPAGRCRATSRGHAGHARQLHRSTSHELEQQYGLAPGTLSSSARRKAGAAHVRQKSSASPPRSGHLPTRSRLGTGRWHHALAAEATADADETVSEQGVVVEAARSCSPAGSPLPPGRRRLGQAVVEELCIRSYGRAGRRARAGLGRPNGHRFSAVLSRFACGAPAAQAPPEFCFPSDEPEWAETLSKAVSRAMQGKNWRGVKFGKVEVYKYSA